MVISNHNGFRALFDKIASLYFIWKRYLYLSVGNGWPAHGTSTVPTLYRHFPSLYRLRKELARDNNGDDSRPHRRRRTGRSIAFAIWRQCASPSNTWLYLLLAGPTAANRPRAAAADEWNRQAGRQRTATQTLLRVVRGQCQKYDLFSSHGFAAKQTNILAAR